MTLQRILAVFAAVAWLLLPRVAGANDGRDRYRLMYSNLFYHLPTPVADGAGFRVLPEDMPGGADGDPAYRWAQGHAIAVVEVAAYHTERALGPGKFEMAVFDLSAENGDTPVDFGPPTKPGQRSQAPRGRHPGGSHDGGLNLDLGYYMTRLQGKVEAEDYAACTEHYAPPDAKGGPLRDLAMCVGPADRLDVDRQAYFYLELLKMHRDRFDGHLLDEVGIDGKVFEAVRGRLEQWRRAHRYGVKAQQLADFDAIMTHDRWGGWQRYHHHHTHVRIQNFSTTGPLRDAVLAVEREDRAIRARLLGRSHSEWPAIVDARLMSYQLERSIEVRVFARSDRRADRVTRVRYRLDGGAWTDPDGDDYRYVFDLPVELRPVERMGRVEAEITTAGGTELVTTEVMLPRLDPRLHVAFHPGDITGSAKLGKHKIALAVRFPAPLRALVTKVVYRVFPAGGGAPTLHVVDAGWFAAEPGAAPPEHGTRTRSTRRCLPLELPRGAGDPPIGLIDARVMLSGRLPITVPLWIGKR